MTASPKIARSVRTFALVESDGIPPEPVPVPAGLSRLVPAAGDEPARCAPARAGGSRAAASCLVEPIDLGTGPALLVLAPDENRFRVNGHRLARVATVEESDTIQLGDGQSFLVAIHTQCEIGLAPEERRDETCAVCRQPLGEHLVYLCAKCQVPVHSDADTGGRDDRLDCLALLSECPSCRAPLIRDGDARTPEGPT